MSGHKQTTLSRCLDDSFEHRLRDVVVDLDEVHSLIGKKIDRALGAFRAVDHEALVRPNRWIAIQERAGKEEPRAHRFSRLDPVAKKPQQGDIATGRSNRGYALRQIEVDWRLGEV